VPGWGKTPLAIHIGKTKAFYGGAIVGEALDMRAYNGLAEYEFKGLGAHSLCRHDVH
jgi:hypothetical protein